MSCLEVGMKLEACDKHNPFYMRVCTIVDIKDGKLKIHMDGWKDEYDFWCDHDSEDIRPIGWCHKTGHPLEKPLANNESKQINDNELVCPTPGCLGVGHVKGPNFMSHRR